MRLERVFPVLTFFLIPFLGSNHLSLYYITIDRFWIETIFILFLIIAVFFQYISRNDKQFFIDNEGIRNFFIFFTPFLAVNVISLIYTWNKFSTLNELNILVLVIGSVYLFSVTDRKDALLKALVIGAAISALCMIIQAKVLFPKLLNLYTTGRNALLLREKVVPFSSFINEATLGGFFLSVFPIGLYFAVCKKNIPCMIASVLIIFGLLFSLSRISVLIAFFSLIFIAFVIIKRGGREVGQPDRTKKRDKKGIMIFFGILLLAFIMFVSIIYGNTYKTGDSEYNNRVQERVLDKLKKVPEQITSLTYRTETWITGAHAFLAQPVFGYGAGTFEYAFRKFYAGGLYTQYAHSSILKIAIETGILGLSAFLFYLYGIILAMKHTMPPTPSLRKGEVRRDLKNDGEDFQAKRALSGEMKYVFISVSLTSGFLFSITNIAFEIPACMITFCVLSSVFLLNSRRYKKNNPSQSSLLKSIVMQITLCAKCIRKEVPYIIPLMIILLLVCSFYFVSKTGLAEKSIENGIMSEENGLLIDTLSFYQDATKYMPIKNEGYIKTTRILMQLYENERETRKKEVLKGHLLIYVTTMENINDKDSELIFTVGIAHGVLGNTGIAEQYLSKAISYYPASAYYIYETAKFYFNNMQIKKAEIAIKSITTYIPQYTTLGNVQHGLYIYKIRDLESVIEYKKGNLKNALKIAINNLEDAENGRFDLSKAREYITQEQLVRYLKNKVLAYETEIYKKRAKENNRKVY